MADLSKWRDQMLAEAAEGIARASTSKARVVAERIQRAIATASDEEIAAAAAQMARLKGAA